MIRCLEVEPDRVANVKVDYFLARCLIFSCISGNVPDRILDAMRPVRYLQLDIFTVIVTEINVCVTLLGDDVLR